jgi:hypothetical protein
MVISETEIMKPQDTPKPHSIRWLSALTDALFEAFAVEPVAPVTRSRP